MTPFRIAFVSAGICGCLAQVNVLYPVTDVMRKAASTVIDYTFNGPNRSLIYDRLAEMTDTFGGRLAGSTSLENALDWVRDQARNVDGLLVTEHSVMVPHWVRGNEWANMTSPRAKRLHFAGLGMSTGTSGVVEAEVMVVKSFDELDARNTSAAGKIVLFNEDWVSYGATVAYRSRCGVAAAKYGAVGVLIRAVGPFSMQTPHTGGTTPAGIGAGSLSIEDANLIARIVARGQTVKVAMYMEAQRLADAPSRNLLIDLPGTVAPNEYVIISGHMVSAAGERVAPAAGASSFPSNFLVH